MNTGETNSANASECNLATREIKKAVVLLNMGGPNNLFEVETFLKNIFSDEHILPMNALMRKIVGTMIVTKRLEKAKQNYIAIGGCSPITSITYDLCKKLNNLKEDTFFTYAMRYTPPFSKMVLEDLKDRGITHITLFSMYPQYSTTTTKSSLKEISTALLELDYSPTIEIIDRYFNNDQYIKIIVDDIEKYIQNINTKEAVLILSAHSLPLKIIEKGDNYQKECEKTASLIHQELQNRNIEFDSIYLSYQSKIGKDKWLKPDTKSVIEKCKDKIEVIYPLSFTIDNSETLYELNIEYRDIAKGFNVKNYIVVSCFNASNAFANLILNLINKDENV